MNKYVCSSCETHLFPGSYFEAIFFGKITEKEGNKTKYCIKNIEFIFCENCGCNILRRWLKNNPDSIRKIFGLNDEIVGQARFELSFSGGQNFLSQL